MPQVQKCKQLFFVGFSFNIKITIFFKDLAKTKSSLPSFEIIAVKFLKSFSMIHQHVVLQFCIIDEIYEKLVAKYL